MCFIIMLRTVVRRCRHFVGSLLYNRTVEQATDIRGAGGTAHIVSFEADSPQQQSAFMALFDRTAEYQEGIRNLETLKRAFPKLKEGEARQRLAGMRREIGAVTARDFFPAGSREQIEGALADAEMALNARFSPDEPHPATHQIRRCDRKEYRGRTWATRERLWIDRVASAWLIRRFIDPKARFVWLKKVKDCPKRAVGFDFDGAQFTHVGTKVTFEVLTAEGPGFAAVMAGARALQPDDDALLDAMAPVLDSLHKAYSSAPSG